MRRLTVTFLVFVSLASLAFSQTPKSRTVKLAVSGMHCENCVAKVDKALRGVEGVKDVKVDLKAQTAMVTLASATVKSDALIKAVDDAGFKASVGKAAPTAAKKEACDGCTGEETKKEGAAKKEDCCKPDSAKKSGSKS